MFLVGKKGLLHPMLLLERKDPSTPFTVCENVNWEIIFSNFKNVNVLENVFRKAAMLTYASIRNYISLCMQ